MIKIHENPNKKPEWLKVKLNTSSNFSDMKNLMNKHSLHTVCEEARCPNIYECWDKRTATVMILGDTCTRACGFCSVKTGKPLPVDTDEPNRVAKLVQTLNFSIRLILFITIPATIGLIILSEPIVNTLWERGEFQYASTQGTAIGTSDQEADLTGIQFTASLGTVVIPNDVVQPSGLQAEFTQGTIIGLGSAVASPSSLTLNASVGTLDPNDMTLGLTGQSFNANIGSISIPDITVGLTGQSASFSIGAVDIFAYGNVDPGQNNSYSDVSTGTNNSYSDVATGSNNSYTDVAA